MSKQMPSHLSEELHEIRFYSAKNEVVKTEQARNLEKATCFARETLKGSDLARAVVTVYDPFVSAWRIAFLLFNPDFPEESEPLNDIYSIDVLCYGIDNKEIGSIPYKADVYSREQQIKWVNTFYCVVVRKKRNGSGVEHILRQEMGPDYDMTTYLRDHPEIGFSEEPKHHRLCGGFYW